MKLFLHLYSLLVFFKPEGKNRVATVCMDIIMYVHVSTHVRCIVHVLIES